LNPPAQLHRPSEQVTFISGTQLLTCNAERRAWHTSCKQIHATVFVWIPNLRISNVPDSDCVRGFLLVIPQHFDEVVAESLGSLLV
jgi:hypothetical protein